MKRGVRETPVLLLHSSNQDIACKGTVLRGIRMGNGLCHDIIFLSSRQTNNPPFHSAVKKTEKKGVNSLIHPCLLCIAYHFAYDCSAPKKRSQLSFHSHIYCPLMYLDIGSIDIENISCEALADFVEDRLVLDVIFIVGLEFYRDTVERFLEGVLGRRIDHFGLSFHHLLALTLSFPRKFEL